MHILLGGKQGHYDLSLRGEQPLRVKKLAQAWLDELSEQLRTGNSPFSIEQDEAMASVINHGFSAQHNPNIKVFDESKCFRPDEKIGALFYQLLLALNQTQFITAKQRMGDLAYDDSEGTITEVKQLRQAIKSLNNLRHSEGDDKDNYAYHNSDLAKIAKEYLNQPLIHDGTKSDKDYQSKLQAQIKHDTQVDGLTDIENLYFTAIKLLKLLREPGIIKHVETRREYQLKTTKLDYKPIELKALDFIALTLHRNYRYQISAADNSAQFIGRFSLDDKLKIKIPAKYAHITEWNLTATPVENDFVDEFFPTLKNQYQSMLSMPGFTLGESDVGIMYANTMIGGDKSLSNLTASAQVAGGAVSLYLAAAIGATGIGTPLAGTIGFIGLDNLQAGTRSLLSQDTTTTYGAQFLEWAGVPKNYGELVYGLFDISAITKAGYALKATNQVYNVVKVKSIATAKPQQLIKAEDVSISVENISKNQKNVINIKATKGLKIPQGLTKKQFIEISSLLKNRLNHVSDDIFIQGSRAGGTAKNTSDIDIGIRVDKDKFEELVRQCFGKPNPSSAKEKTMLHAIDTGKIQAGEAKLSHLRKEIQNILDMDVDISIILDGGKFDNPPYIPIK
ncbi:nucleotidyltransferase domain-containing protein [Orbus wheelerorum]|uniref:nucleotidyltransferase domain-containing protein n=1 Tax=Orbus wheelerorum TaxID=3074111 RepID=UPI00370DDCA6